MPRRSRSQLRPPVPGPATCATVLIAVTGESPAVLTETVWALARENPPVLPARVIVVTTTVGAARLQAELLAPSPAFAGRSPWQALRDTLLAGRADADRLLALEDARVITGPAGPDGCARRLDDLRTRADNDAAADFILEQVRAITANADTRLVASIAGGRKTMGALLYAAMTLVGRESDRLTHVLVNAPFDQRLDPAFYFPSGKPSRHVLRGPDGRQTIHLSSTAVIELAEVPFVPLRNAFEDLGRPAGGFAGLVARYGRELRELAEPPVVSFDVDRNAVCFDGRPVTLENAMQLAIVRAVFDLQTDLRGGQIDFMSFAQIVRGRHGGIADLPGHDRRAAAAIAARVRPISPPAPGAVPDWVKDLDDHAVSRALSILRERIRAVCPLWRPRPRTLLLPSFRLAGQP